MSVTIKYKGNTIASANTDTTKTLQTSGKYCEGDIVVENVQDGGITPTGSITLTEERSYDVTDKATAVVDFSSTRANLAEAVTAKGVDTLPTSSFDTIAANIGLIGGASIASGTFTFPGITGQNTTIFHGLGVKPNWICVMPTEFPRLNEGLRYYGAQFFGDENGYNYSGVLYTYGGTMKYDSIKFRDSTSGGVTDITSTTFTLANNYPYMWGLKYQWVAIFVE